MKRVIVIGGGASGMTAAIAAARLGAEVTVLEHMDRVGKKILSTGNGKCNYTNREQGLQFYRGEDPSFVVPVFRQFGYPETIIFFREMGIYPKERNGCVYPASGQASSVLDVLRMELRRLNVRVVTDCSIRTVEKAGKSFRIEAVRAGTCSNGSADRRETAECHGSADRRKVSECHGSADRRKVADCHGSADRRGMADCHGSADRHGAASRLFFADACIIACGGKAFPKSGSDGSAFHLIQKLGHSVIGTVPALVPMTARQAYFKSIAGIRSEVSITLYVDRDAVCRDRGEIQLTDYGISGIPAFQVSRYASRALECGKKVWAELDFAPYLGEEEFGRELSDRFFRFGSGKSCQEALTGLFHKKLIPVFLRENKISPDGAAEKASRKSVAALAGYCKRVRIDITGTKGFDHAQACAGGVSTAEICGETMESKIVPGLYFAGEVVDIDGMCGGYNLQWAWSSGFVAGSHAAEPEP